MLVNEYETTLVLRPELAGDAIESTLDRVRNSIEKMDGTLLEINHWGRKKLAYPIEKQIRAIYVHTHYLGKDNLVGELERNLRISDSVMRYLTIRMEQGIDPADREVRDYVAPEYDADAVEEVVEQVVEEQVVEELQTAPVEEGASDISADEKESEEGRTSENEAPLEEAEA